MNYSGMQSHCTISKEINLSAIYVNMLFRKRLSSTAAIIRRLPTENYGGAAILFLEKKNRYLIRSAAAICFLFLLALTWRRWNSAIPNEIFLNRLSSKN